MADIGTNRRRVWRRTGAKDSAGREIIEDTEYDIVEVFGKEVLCPSNDPVRARRNDGVEQTTQYVGIHFLDANSPEIDTPFGGCWGGLRRTA